MMINFKTVEVLTKKGYAMKDVLAAIRTAETAGQAELDGWVIRYNGRGEMITVHPSWCGIYVGDFNSHIIFQKDLSYTYSRYGFMSAKHRDLPQVLAKLDEYKTNGFILCECCACDYERRKKQVEKAGYTIHKSNISACESETSTCVFLIA